MKTSDWIKSFKIFGILVHFLTVIALAAIGFFDFLGTQPLLNSTAQLLHTLTSTQSGTTDGLSNHIIIGITNFAPTLLSVTKGLCVSAAVAFLAHLISFFSQKK